MLSWSICINRWIDPLSIHRYWWPVIWITCHKWSVSIGMAAHSPWDRMCFPRRFSMATKMGAWRTLAAKCCHTLICIHVGVRLKWCHAMRTAPAATARPPLWVAPSHIPGIPVCCWRKKNPTKPQMVSMMGNSWVCRQRAVQRVPQWWPGWRDNWTSSWHHCFWRDCNGELSLIRLCREWHEF